MTILASINHVSPMSKYDTILASCKTPTIKGDGEHLSNLWLLSHFMLPNASHDPPMEPPAAGSFVVVDAVVRHFVMIS